jgi:DNA modification methylase
MMKNIEKLNFLKINQVYCGDAATLIRDIEPESIALSVWSPPYHVGKSYEKDNTFEDWKALLKSAIQAHCRVLVKGGFLVVNIADILCFRDETMPKIQAPNVAMLKCPVTREDVLKAKKSNPTFNRNQMAALLGCSEQTIDRRLNGNNIRGGKHATQTRVQLVGQFIEAFAYEVGLYLYDRRVWIKDPNWVNNQWHSNSYRSVSEYEDLYIFWKPGETQIDRNRLEHGEWAEWGSRQVWNFKSVRTNDDHVAKFPLELPRRFIRLLTCEGDTVLDCFMGSGTTAIAALKEKRHYIGIDITPEYVQLAKRNIKKEQEVQKCFLF